MRRVERVMCDNSHHMWWKSVNGPEWPCLRVIDVVSDLRQYEIHWI